MARPLTPGELWQRARQLRALQQPCRLCPRRCGARRAAGPRAQSEPADGPTAHRPAMAPADDAATPGFCGQPTTLQVAVTCAHGGEEPPLSGQCGVGNVFVAGCTMRCHFCQNHQISQPDRCAPAWRSDPHQLAQQLARLARRGCHNIGWVSATQHLPALVESLALLRQQGIDLPVVLNCNGYQRLEVLRLLEGVVDIYLPDAKYADAALARRLSATPDYVEVNRRALKEMLRQVGQLQLDPVSGLARRGLLVRHLVLPGALDNTRGVLQWIAQTLGQSTHVSLMAQYFPAHRTLHHPPLPALARRLTAREYRRALGALEQAGLDNGWVQQRATGDAFRPDFHRPQPFAAAPAEPGNGAPSAAGPATAAGGQRPPSD